MLDINSKIVVNDIVDKLRSRRSFIRESEGSDGLSDTVDRGKLETVDDGVILRGSNRDRDLLAR